MLHECRATHAYGSFGTQNSMVTFILKFGLRKSQCQIKLGRILNSKFSYISMPILSSFVSDKKRHLLLCTTIKKAQNALKSNVITLRYRFLSLNSQKLVHCFEILHACRLHMSNFITVIPFLDYSKILDFIGVYFWKNKTLSFGGKNKKQKSEKAILYSFPFHVFWPLWGAFFFNPVHS